MDSVVNAISGSIDALSAFSVWLYELSLYQLGYYSAWSSNFLDKQQITLIDVYDQVIGFWFNYTDYLYDYIKTADLIAAYNALYASDAGYFFDVFKISALLSGVITASLIRFAIRRLPVVG
ncbi:MAG: hypothetical protein LUP96_05205 [Methylococcaceae bacterium]|nr:hypothetical protein [Methylococcaceae bacterium]